MLALEHRQIPPSLHFERPNPQIDFAASPFYVNAAAAPLAGRTAAPRRAGVSSFGIGGTNAHVVLEEAPAAGARRRRAAPGSSCCSRPRTATALERGRGRPRRPPGGAPGADLADVAYTLQVGRRALRAPPGRGLPRRGGRRRAAARRATRERLRRRRDRPGAPAGRLPLPRPGRAVRRHGRASSTSRAGLPRRGRPLLRASCAPHLGLDLRDVLCPGGRRGGGRGARCEQTARRPAGAVRRRVRPGAALDELGGAPAGDARPQLGEYVAACLAGVFSLEDALAPGGGARPADAGAARRAPCSPCRCREAEVAPLLGRGARRSPPSTARRCCVVAGPGRGGRGAGGRARRRAASPRRRLHTSHAFHSAMMEPILARLRRARCARAALRPPRIPFVSNLTGTWITAGGGDRPRLLGAPPARRRALRRRRSRRCSPSPSRVLLEVGPGPDARDPGPRSTRPPARAGRARLAAAIRRSAQADAPVLLAAPGPALAGRRRRRLAAASTPASGAAGCRCRPTPSSASATGSSHRPAGRRRPGGGRRASARSCPTGSTRLPGRPRRRPRRPRRGAPSPLAAARR